MFEVGGCVRDEILGLPSKDIDFAVEAESWSHLKDFLAQNGFEVFLENEEFLTLRARFPRTIAIGAPPWGKYRGLTADFVLCRKDGAYTDGRRPDTVVPGDIYDDLARRDFTMNAIARDVNTGVIIDPFDGVADIEHKLIRAVGLAGNRLHEDALRALRAVRFSIMKGFEIDPALWAALSAPWLPPLLANVSAERRRDELFRAMHFNTLGTLKLLHELPPAFMEAALGDAIWLKPTMED
jgi:tRNA nucleotidyltransferase/poly(A) polymerase